MSGILIEVGEVSGKIDKKLFNLSCIPLVAHVNYAVIIMKSLYHILIIDNNTNTDMIWV